MADWLSMAEHAAPAELAPPADPGLVVALQARIDELTAYLALLRQHPALISAALDITPTQARILGLLRRASPRFVTRPMFEAELFCGRAICDKLLHVHICKLRQRLGAHGLVIETVRGKPARPGGPGWRLTEAAAAELDAEIEASWSHQVGSAA